MKAYKLLIAICALSTVFGSCKEDELLTYGEEKNIYFSWVEGAYLVDSTTVYLRTEEFKDAYVTVFTMGRQAPYDREIAYEVVDDYTTAQPFVGFDPDTGQPIGEYEMVKSYIPANESFGYIQIRLYASQALDDAEAVGKRLKVRLLPNSEFSTDMISIHASKDLEKVLDEDGNRVYSPLDYKLVFNSLDVSVMWLPDVYQSSRAKMMNAFGEFSRKKVNYICEKCNLPMDFFDPELGDDQVYKTPEGYYLGVMSDQICMFWARIVNQAIREDRQAGNLDAITDEDGTEMRMGVSLI